MGISRLAGLEPAARGLEIRCSIRLSYRRNEPHARIAAAREGRCSVGVRGFEPPTPCSQSRCATGLRHTPV